MPELPHLGDADTCMGRPGSDNLVANMEHKTNKKLS